MSDSRINKIIVPVLLILAFFFANVSHAGLVGKWDLPKRQQTMTVEYRDDNHIRMGLGDGSMYFLYKEGATYLITGDSVVDADAFRNEVKDWAIAGFIAKRMAKRASRVKTQTVTKTDRLETIAGIEGDVYIAEMNEPGSNKTLTREVVITTDPRLVQLKAAMDRFANSQMDKISRPEFGVMHKVMQSSYSNDQAILRYHDRFQVMAIEEKEIPLSRFELPQGAEIKPMPGLADIGQLLKIMTPLGNDD